LKQLPDEAQKNLLSTTFFPNAISGSFMDALRAVFLFSAGLALLAALFSAIRGKRFIYDESTAEDKDEAGVLTASAVMH
jgi:hypothetical protein